MSTPHISQLRSVLMDTLAALTNRHNPMEPDRARAVAQVASVLVDTAKVEIDYIKATGQDNSDFLDGMKAPLALPRGPAQTRWANDTPAKLAAAT